MPTQGEARSRQTAYLATEAWWKTRVEALSKQYRQRAEWEMHLIGGLETSESEARRAVLRTVADTLDALLAERPSR